MDFGFWIDSTDKSRGGYHQEILGQKPGFFTKRLRAAGIFGKKFAYEGLEASRSVFMKLPAIVLR